MRYKITYQENNKIEEMHIDSLDLKQESLPKNIIKIKRYDKKRDFIKKNKISSKKLNQFFYELNIMLEANISLKDAFTILAKNRKCKKEKKLALVLLNGLNSSKSMQFNLQEFKLDPLLNGFFEIVNKKGNIKFTMKALSLLLDFKIELKNQLFKAFSYPVLLLITLAFSLFSIFYFVLPSFESLIMQNSLKANSSTMMLFSLKEFVTSYFLVILIFFISTFFIFSLLYLSSPYFKYQIDKISLLYLPVFSSILLTYELYKIFIVLNILQKADYEFHDSIKSLNVLVKNKYMLDKIAHIENLLKSGRSISYAFESVELFDDVVINLIQTGEVSNQIGVTTKEIEKIYHNKFQEKVKLFSFWIQPIIFIIIMGLILWIIFAIFMPMWNMSDMIMM